MYPCFLLKVSSLLAFYEIFLESNLGSQQISTLFQTRFLFFKSCFQSFVVKVWSRSASKLGVIFQCSKFFEIYKQFVILPLVISIAPSLKNTLSFSSAYTYCHDQFRHWPRLLTSRGEYAVPFTPFKECAVANFK